MDCRPGWAAKLQRLTKAQRVALQVLREHGPVPARQFARLRWPSGFRRTSNTGLRGHRVLLGAGASMKAGAMLRRLCTLSLVESGPQFTLEDGRPLTHYWLTEYGVAELVSAEERAEKYGQPGPRERSA